MPDEIDEDWPTLDVMTQRYFDLVMERVSWNRARAAGILGIDRQTIRRMAARRGAEGAIFHPVHRDTQKTNRAAKRLREMPPDRVDDVLDDLLGASPSPQEQRERRPMRPERRTLWQDVQVWTYASSTVEPLEGNRRLLALLEWKGGASKKSIWFMHAGREITRAEEVDWTRFPEALDG